jgi:NAD-dependent dihydropyrimidine dehydrogenase PreA subunit
VIHIAARAATSHGAFELEQQMAFVIAKPCIGVKDTACVVACPVDCIHPTKDEAAFAAADQLFIDPEECIHCGICVAECPVAAIFAVEDVPQEWSEFIEKNAAHYRRAAPARTTATPS